jgi:hypothetical protein
LPEIITDSITRFLALRQFQELRGKIQPRAEATGFRTDEDVFKAVS